MSRTYFSTAVYTREIRGHLFKSSEPMLSVLLTKGQVGSDSIKESVLRTWARGDADFPLVLAIDSCMY